MALSAGTGAVVVAVAAVTTVTTVLAVAGTVAVLAGTAAERRRLRAVGALASLVSVLGAAYAGVGAWHVLAGVVAVVVSSDVAERTSSLAAARIHAPTRFHVRRSAWTALLATTAGVTAVLASTVPLTRSPGASALALVGGVLVALSLRD